jgi:hypothetical protein
MTTFLLWCIVFFLGAPLAIAALDANSLARRGDAHSARQDRNHDAQSCAMGNLVPVLVLFVLALAACGGSAERTYAEPCVNKVAKHDFGAPNPGTVAAYGTSPGCTSSVFPGPNAQAGYAQFKVPVMFQGNVAIVACSPGCGNGMNTAMDFTEVVFTLDN